MNAVSSGEEEKKHELKSSEGCIGGDNDRRCDTWREYRVEEVGKEGRHGEDRGPTRRTAFQLRHGGAPEVS